MPSFTATVYESQNYNWFDPIVYCIVSSSFYKTLKNNLQFGHIEEDYHMYNTEVHSTTFRY